MDLKIPNVVKPIELKDFAPEFGEAKIFVWVNPTRALRVELVDNILPVKTTNEQVKTWLSTIWSQGPDESTHFTPEQIELLGQECRERAPKLLPWLFQRTVDLLCEYYIAKKKPSNMPPSS